MTNIASALKNEISRVARKEVRAETHKLKAASTQYRSDIASLKRKVAALEKLNGSLSKEIKKALPDVAEAPPAEFRYSARSFAAQRSRLGLTAVQMGALLGVSDQSVNKWEAGKARPRPSNFAALAALRTLSKEQAAAVVGARKVKRGRE
jgi:DNA-binding transcriptional regulator YiaG